MPPGQRFSAIDIRAGAPAQAAVRQRTGGGNSNVAECPIAADENTV